MSSIERESAHRIRMSPDQRRSAILDAAHQLFRTTDPNVVSLDDIATAAGVTRGLIHHYFGSKQDVFVAVLRRATYLPPEVSLVPAGLRDADLDTVISACVSMWMTLIQRDDGFGAIMAVPALGADPRVVDIVQAARDDLVERMLSELPLPATLNTEHLRVALIAFSGFARSACEEWLGRSSVTTKQAEALLAGTLRALIHDVVPAMS